MNDKRPLKFPWSSSRGGGAKDKIPNMILTPTGGDNSVRRRKGDQPRDHAQSSQFDIPTNDKTCDDTESNNTAWSAADVETAAALESTEVTTMGAE